MGVGSWGLGVSGQVLVDELWWTGDALLLPGGFSRYLVVDNGWVLVDG